MDDIRRAAEARREFGQTRAPNRTHSGFNDERPGKCALLGQAEADSTQQFLAWRQAERAARNHSSRSAARSGRARWLPVAAVLGATLAVSIWIDGLRETGSEPAAAPALKPVDQMQSGPPLQLRLERDLEQFARRLGASTPERSTD